MTYRTAAGTGLLPFVSLHWGMVLLVNLGIVELPRAYGLPWAAAVAIGGNLAWLALALAVAFEEPARR